MFRRCIDAGIAASDAPFVFTNLLDYVDPDSIPRNLDSATTESVPMLNEVRVITVVVPSQIVPGSGSPPPDAATTLLVIDIEWFYPFVRATTNCFEVGYRIEVAPAPGSAVDVADSQRFLAAFATGVVEMACEGRTKWYDTVRIITTNAGTQSVIRADPGEISFDVNLWLAVSNNNTVVDAVPWPESDAPLSIGTSPINVPTSVTEFLSTAIFLSTNGVETVDPRSNWSAELIDANWFPYEVLGPDHNGTIYSGSALPGTHNFVTELLFSNGVSDGHTCMYIADTNLMHSAELTFLLRGASVANGLWNTIRLVLPNSPSGNPVAVDRVLDHFIVGPSSSRSRGRINPNTRQADVLAALFKDMPLEQFPGEGSNHLSWTEAKSLAGSFISSRTTVFTNLSDVGIHTGYMDSAVLSSYGPFEKESVLRNSAGLLNTRQELFVVLLAGRTRVAEEEVWVDGRSGADTILGVPAGWYRPIHCDQRAVALVWRDPYPDASDEHDIQLISFKWLTDDGDASNTIFAIDDVAEDLQELVCDTLLPCEIGSASNEITFVSYSDAATAVRRAAQRVRFRLDGDVLLKELSVSVTNGPYPTFTNTQVSTLASNVQLFSLSAASSAATNPPGTVTVSLGVSSNQRATREVYLADQIREATNAVCATEYYAGFDSQAYGDVTPTSAWYHAGTAVLASATAEYAYHFEEWDGPLEAVRTNENPICVWLLSPTSMTAVFSINFYNVVSSWEGLGDVSPSGKVSVIHGGTQAFVSVADQYYTISEVRTNGVSIEASSGISNLFSWLDVTAPGNLHAVFAPLLTSNAVPYWWLAFFGITNGGFEFESMQDHDGDGANASNEYFAGTMPTNRHSVFAVSNFTTAGPAQAVLGWHSVSDKTYSVTCATNIESGVWIPVASNVAATPPLNTVTVNVSAGSARYYRVTLE